MRGEVAQRRSVDDGVDHVGSRCGLGQGGVVVANGDGGNLSVAITNESSYIESATKKEEAHCFRFCFLLVKLMMHLHVEEVVAVRVGNVVANALGEVGHHVDAPGVKDFAQLVNPLGALRPGDAGLEHRSIGLALDKGLVLVGRHSDGGAGEAAGRVEGGGVERSDGRAQCLGSA